MIAVGMKCGILTGTIASVTVGGTPATLYRRDNGVGFGMEIWYHTGFIGVNPVTITVNFPAAYQACGNSVIYNGVDTVAPFDVSGFGSGIDNAPLVGFSTAIDNCVGFAHCSNFSNFFPGPVLPVVSRWNQQDSVLPAGNQISQNGCDSNPSLPISPPGAYGFLWTLPGAFQWFTQAVAMKPLLSSGAMQPGRAGSSVGVRN